MEERKLRIGLIGTGGIAHSHMRAYLNRKDAVVVAGADLVPGRAEAFFKEFEVDARAYTDYKAMIREMELDAVSVCTYNSTHAECTIYALEHGLPVLLEKPMCVTLEEAVAIRKAEKASGKIVSVGFQPRFDANMQMIKKVVQSGQLGKIYYVQTGGGRRKGIPAYRDSFIEADKGAIGAVGDIGCYSLDLVLNALGHPKPLTVTGRVTDYFGKDPDSYTRLGMPEAAARFGVDDFASAYIRLENDIILDFRIAWHMHLDTPGDTILMGTKGSLRVPSTDCWNGSFDKPLIVYHDIAGQPTQSEIPLLKNEMTLWDMKIKSFLKAVKTGGKAPVPTEEIIINQAIIDGIVRSSKLGREVEIHIPEV